MHYFSPESGCATPFTYVFTVQQREMAAAIRLAVVDGGDQAIAASRGEGKTTLFERLLLKYTLQGLVKFSVLFAATGTAAENSLESIKLEVETNDFLYADYPEVCEPVRALENTPQRAHFQIVGGVRHDDGEPYEMASSKFSWCGQSITFPNVPGSPASGGIIATHGLDSAVRGIKKKGRRVDVAGIDDPDTEETVRSADQAKKLEDRIDRTIAALGGQKRRVARVMLTTIQNQNCVSYRFTDPQQKPSWKPRRFRFLIRKPDRMDLWDEYVTRKRQDWQSASESVEVRSADEFYDRHRDAMDKGAIVSNPNRYTAGERSALQFYFNEVARIGQDAVSTEYDNDPPQEYEGSEELTPDQIARKLSNLPRGLVPLACHHVTAMIDVHESILYYTVAAWEDGFTGYVIDYGTFPDQKTPYFSHTDAKVTLASLFPKAGKEGRIYAGLEAVTERLLGREWKREDEAAANVGRCLIDAGYATDTVLKFCRQSRFAALLTPTKGMGLGPGNKPFHEYQKRPGDRVGHRWRIPAAQGRAVRQALVDANYWKTFIHSGLATTTGDRVCLSLFGSKPEAHRMYADHLTAEKHDLQFSKTFGRWVDVWGNKTGRHDNHFFDTLAGCAVAASMLGVTVVESADAKPLQPRRYRSIAQIKAERPGRRQA